MPIFGKIFEPNKEIKIGNNISFGEFESVDYQVKYCDDLTILFKGNIYDIKGYDFKKGDDVLETILHVYRDEGYEGFVRLNGKSTIIIFEKTRPKKDCSVLSLSNSFNLDKFTANFFSIPFLVITSFV